MSGVFMGGREGKNLLAQHRQRFSMHLLPLIKIYQIAEFLHHPLNQPSPRRGGGGGLTYPFLLQQPLDLFDITPILDPTQTAYQHRPRFEVDPHQAGVHHLRHPHQFFRAHLGEGYDGREGVEGGSGEGGEGGEGGFGGERGGGGEGGYGAG